MTAKFRNKLFYTFIILFIVITITTSLYAAGYRLNLAPPFNWSRLLQKTGMIYINTKPSGASVYLERYQKSIFTDLQKYQGVFTTPIKIKNVLPGKYKLSLQLEQYWPWEKDIEVQPGQAIYLEDLTLFKKSLPLIIYNSPLQDLEFSPNLKYAFLTESRVIVNLKTESAMPLPDTEINSWQWSSDSTELITDQYIFTPADGKINWLQLDNSVVINLKCFKNNKQIFYQSGNSIHQFDISSQDVEVISSINSCQDYLISNNKLITIANQGESTYVQITDLKNSSQQEFILPLADNYHFVELDNAYVNIWQPDYQTLYVIDPNNQYNSIKAKIDNLKYVVSLDNNQLLYANDTEIFSYNLDTRQNTLITRVSEKITSLLWSPSQDYIIFSTPKSIYVLDRQKRDYTITKIITMEEISTPSLDSKKNQLYFSGKIGQQSGVYKLSL